MRYYHPEHLAAYRRVEREGLTQWNDLFEEDRTGDFEVFPNRAFLERGFRVDAIDLIPEAIRLARRFARERGLDVNFAVQDVCAMPATTKQYDMVLDSYCLQSIVTDADRSRVLAAVHDRLKPNGRYILSTAMYDPNRFYEDDFRYDATTGICYQKTTAPTADAVHLDSIWYLPHRRHLRPEALQAELERAGLYVVSRQGGDVVATRLG
ncbi:class I SAM-dependent methyltransferase [Kribbella sp. NPDC003505]|uniref:class I SAM-dependent methyltransferase n=1 Tax=Kribbella sp. NPDC003505 TaxID=3154448 RepID=UPI0033B1E6B7